MAKHVVPAVAGAVALSLVGGGIWAATAYATKDVALSVDGDTKQVAVRADTVADVLDSQGIALGEHDVVQPSLDAAVVDGLAVSVRFARPLEVTVDGVKKTLWTTATTVEDALTQLNINADPASKLSTSRSASIGREGLTLEILTAKNVTVTVAGKPTALTLAGTVRDALTKVGVTPDSDDIVTPAIDSELTEGAKVAFVKVDTKTVSKTVDVAFSTTKQNSADLYVGETKIQTKGVAGSATQQVLQTFHDGALAAEVVQSSTQTKAPVTQIQLVGTKARPAADTTPANGASCKASYYWQGQRTANGEWFNTNDFTAAHKTLPFNTRVKVTNVANGKTTIVRINDRGPYIAGRCLDLSTAAMSAIGGTSAGVITVTYEVL